MKKVHIVPHMHWDREWYFTTEESRILLVNNMEEIMIMLEENEDYPYYVLDGQTAILEDYFAAKPENKERVKSLVQKGKLIIGPWYSQTDEMVVGGESIVRNLLYGIKDCASFGNHMKIGYLPDSFGQSAKMPQILNGFDIYHSIFWRGVSESKGTDKTEFYWKGEDDSKVLTQLFPLGYAIGKYLPLDKDALKVRLDKYFGVLDRGATTENIILPNGHDQMPVQRNIFEIIKVLKEVYPERDFFLSNYENVFKEIEKQENLAVLEGEFLDGKYMRVHRSIFSTRMDIKAANVRIENKITNILEPLASIAYSLGFEYHSGLIELIWKEIMKNHAHDSIGCCCSDIVHKEIMARFELAEDKVNNLINFYKRIIVDAMSKDITLDKLTAFNLLPYDREEVIRGEIITKFKGFKLVDENGTEKDFEVLKTEIVDAGLIDRQIVHYGNYDPFVRYTVEIKDTVPSMGYKTYLIKECEKSIEVSATSNVSEVETEFYKIDINENGTLNIKDKKNNVDYKDVLLFEDGADDGDEYDFSPLEDDFLIYNNNIKCESIITKNLLSTEITVKYVMDIPKDLDSRKAKVVDCKMPVEINLTLHDNNPIIDAKVTITNLAKDHRVRAYIPTQIASSLSLSDNQFGTIERAVIDPSMDVWEKEGWDERPDPIYPMMSFVALKDENKGVSVLTNSTREFEIIGEGYDTIALTLFRSVGVLGKEELFRRPGRPSGIKLETPDSQMIGEVKLDFALYFFKNDASMNNLTKVAKEYLTPVVSYNKMPHNAMKLNEANFTTPYNYSLLKEDNNQVTLSTLKKSEEDNGLLIRFFNGTNEAQKAQFTINKDVKASYMTNLNEKKLEEVSYDNNKIDMAVNKNVVKNIYIEM
jgi:mannosylglycerate hydrolase